MNATAQGECVLAIFPFTRGLAFVLFQSPLCPRDWGIKEVRGEKKNARTLRVAEQLIERAQPDILVLPALGRGRTKRLAALNRVIGNSARGRVVEVHLLDRDQIRACFERVGAVTRYEIAQAIAAQIDVFGHQLPPMRKIWKSEDSRMGLFDAASLALTYYSRQGVSTPADESVAAAP